MESQENEGETENLKEEPVEKILPVGDFPDEEPERPVDEDPLTEPKKPEEEEEGRGGVNADVQPLEMGVNETGPDSQNSDQEFPTEDNEDHIEKISIEPFENPNIRVLTESEEELLQPLKMTDSEFEEFKNPYCDSIISLSSCREDFRDMAKNIIVNESNIDLVMTKILEENVFVLVYEEGLKKHRKIMTLLTELGEPYYMFSSNILRDSIHNAEFWNAALSDDFPPPFVIYNNKAYKTLEELEELLYQRLVGIPETLDSKTMGEDEFDLVVVGSSTAGYTAATYGKKFCERVALIDVPTFVSGRAVRTAKKIMHSSALLLKRIRLGYKLGFNSTGESKLSWSSLVEQIGLYVKKHNFSRIITLRRDGVTVFRSKGKFENDADVAVSDPGENTNSVNLKKLKGNYYIIATGTTQRVPKEIIGANKYCIMSDKLMFEMKPPGDTLIIGDSEEALEYAGILSAFDFNVSVITSFSESLFFEEEFVCRIRRELEFSGVEFIDKCKVLKVSPSSNGSRKTVEGIFDDGCVFSGEFDTVVLAFRRVPRTSHMGLTRTRVEVSRSRYIEVDDSDKTSQGNVFALGSVAEGRPKSQAVSEKSAHSLIDRLFNCGSRNVQYSLAPNLLLTPLEYGSIGVNEKLAEDVIKMKLSNVREISVYESREDSPFTFQTDSTLVKMFVSGDEDGYKRVLGFHLLGSDVGETLQGISAIIENDRYIHRLDKVLNCCLNTKIMDNVELKRTLSWSNEIDLSPTVSDIKLLKRVHSILCAGDMRPDKQSSTGVKLQDKSEQKEVTEIEKLCKSRSSLDYSGVHSEIEQYTSISESSSCGSLNSQNEMNYLRKKEDFIEMSFENERIPEENENESNTDN